MADEHDEGAGEELSLRDALASAFAEDREAAPAERVAAPAEAQVKPPAASEPPRADGRDASGRFAPKAGEAKPEGAQAQPSAQAPAAQSQAQAETPRAPASWTAAAKAQFSTLPPEIQSEITRREREVEQGWSQQQSRLELANRFDSIMEPFRDRMAAEGLDPLQGVQRLLAAQSFLEKNPVQGVLFLARSYGVHPAQLAQAAGGQQPVQGQAQLPPEVRALAQQVQTLQQQLQQRDQSERSSRLQTVQSEIQSFADDAAHPYFHNVKEDMVALLSSNRAKDLQDAYDKAVWANPETRKLIQADQSKQAEAEKLRAQRESTAGAKRASGSVVGAPAPGASPPGAGNSNRSLRDDLQDAFRSARA